jgi:hypothetical protein
MNTGDLEPPWIVDITADDETDFTTATWRFEAYRETTDGKETVITDTTPDVTPGANVWSVAVAHAWVSGETATAGVLHAVPIAVWPGGREQSFPGATIELQTP